MFFHFHPHHGGRIHVLHQTHSQAGAPVSLCRPLPFAGGVGTRAAATCRTCVARDHVLALAPRQIDGLRAATQLRALPVPAQEGLVTSDLLTTAGALTARGRILAADFGPPGPAPWVDTHGVRHARPPLARLTWCTAYAYPEAVAVGTQAYAKLATVHAGAITCMQCLEAAR